MFLFITLNMYLPAEEALIKSFGELQGSTGEIFKFMPFLRDELLKNIGNI